MPRLINPELGHLLWKNIIVILNLAWPIFLGGVWTLLVFRLGRVVENRMWVRHPEFHKAASSDAIKDLKIQERHLHLENERLQNRNKYLTTVVQMMVNITNQIKKV